MKRIMMAVVFAATLASGMPACAQYECAEAMSVKQALCGPAALLAVCSKFGIKADIRGLARECKTEKSGTTLFVLKEAAEKRGLTAVGVKMRADALLSLGTTSIAYLWGGHYVLVDSSVRPAQIIDAPVPELDEKPVAVPETQFRAAYSSFALILAKAEVKLPQDEAPAPDLRLDSYIFDLGAARPNSVAGKTIKLRNAGAQPLLIHKIETSCPCLTVEAPQSSIGPGETADVNLLLDTTGYEGVLARSASILSNDPVSPRVVIDVTAFVRPARLLPSTRHVDFGRISRHAGTSVDVVVKDPGDGSLVMLDPQSNSSFVTANLSRHRSAVSGRAWYTLTIGMKPGAALGRLGAMVSVRTNCPKEPLFRVPVVGEVVPDIKVEPELIFFGMPKQGKVVIKSITISTADKGRFAITEVRNPIPLVDIRYSRTGNSCTLTATLLDTAPAGAVNGDLVVRTDDADQPEIHIPMRGFVGEWQPMHGQPE